MRLKEFEKKDTNTIFNKQIKKNKRKQQIY